MIEIRELGASEVARLAEIDRSERVTTGYSIRDGELVAEAVDWEVPPWSAEGDGDHAAPGYVAGATELLAEGGSAFGAFEGGSLVGIITYRPRLTETIDEVALMHVSCAYRRQGVGSRLIAEAFRVASESGAESIYVSATPSGSAVRFYRNHGFEPTDEPHPERFEHEPEDMHMVKML